MLIFLEIYQPVLILLEFKMSQIQTQTETSVPTQPVPQVRKKARPLAEILGKAFFDMTEPDESELPEETHHYVWMGLSKGDSFYTIRAGNREELEAIAESLSDGLSINWTVKFSIPRDAYDHVPVGVGEHSLVNKDSRETGRNSYLDLRNSLLEHGIIERDDYGGHMPKVYRNLGDRS